tara:strand:- start:738 stop:1541 length:804 start_codon:yes stop_codon:yes gene_type:complete
MEYLSGYTVKPGRVTVTGEVLFTDGTNEMMANQITCEAYGYTYDIATGTCNAYQYNTNLERNISNINNKFNGAGNTTELGTNTVQINGTNNTTKGFNNNCLINGSANEIANGINNSTVIGSKGVARSDCEFVTSSSDGVGQYSTFLLSTTTREEGAYALGINGDGTKTVIPRLAETLYGYTIDVFSYRTGGTSGSGAVGDRGFFKVKGLVFDAAATETLTVEASKGFIAGMSVATAYTGSDMEIEVVGIADMHISWGAVAKFYQMKI